jgi:hypothetical protein
MHPLDCLPLWGREGVMLIDKKRKFTFCLFYISGFSHIVYLLIGLVLAVIHFINQTRSIPCHKLPILCLFKQAVHQHQRQHRLSHGHNTRYDAGIMTTPH